MSCFSQLIEWFKTQFNTASGAAPTAAAHKYEVLTNPAPVPVSPPTDASFLYVILPYFNYCFYERRKELFIEFVKRIQHQENVRYVVVEAYETDENPQLSREDLPGVFLHLQVETKNRIWLKENLINIGVAHLPRSWTAMAWVDADLTFLNPQWVAETLRTLQTTADVVQLFETCINLGPNGEAMKTDKGFGYMRCTSGKPYTKTHKYGFWHPGFAWACNRVAYEQMGGLIDWGILGSGDHHMALALIGLADISHPGNIHPNYAKRLKAFEKRVAGLRLGYVSGVIHHHWHGRLADRRYRERWDILTQNKYDPETDIYKTSGAVIQLTLTGLRLQPEIHEYFIGRQEDRKDA
jgi:hypothetical protein